ncbi:hypothetical protein QTP81_04215 [Alteromonas sp. ASW11-36]|uniref:Uncharacterized protein n=1 Tax=Alteromonas arenosi TaxID=3055817 RepID=A0ABT7SUX6_9ALTE|nr:hypothetical protein [Alteromonas sp. ASW11-36]MDM7859804.1 hypothetical protein [Alteromonas sp. ASW11-36]
MTSTFEALSALPEELLTQFSNTATSREGHGYFSGSGSVGQDMRIGLAIAQRVINQHPLNPNVNYHAYYQTLYQAIKAQAEQVLDSDENGYIYGTAMQIATDLQTQANEILAAAQKDNHCS